MPRVVVCSEFFADIREWQRLRQDLLPALCRQRSPVRAWSAGCHTGKEVFSLAIAFAASCPTGAYSLLATDKDVDLLAMAQSGGPFSERDVAQVDPGERAAYFNAGGPPYVVADHLRRNVTFKHHDLLTDAFETDFDLILFRNVSPFFSEAENDRVHQKLRDALRAGGLLFVAATDPMPNWRNDAYLRLSDCLYQKR